MIDRTYSVFHRDWDFSTYIYMYLHIHIHIFAVWKYSNTKIDKTYSAFHRDLDFSTCVYIFEHSYSYISSMKIWYLKKTKIHKTYSVFQRDLDFSPYIYTSTHSYSYISGMKIWKNKNRQDILGISPGLHRVTIPWARLEVLPVKGRRRHAYKLSMGYPTTFWGFEQPDVSMLKQNIANNVNPKCCVCISSSSGIWWLPNDQCSPKKLVP